MNMFEEKYPEFGLIGEDAKNFWDWLSREPKAMLIFSMYNIERYKNERFRGAINRMKNRIDDACNDDGWIYKNLLDDLATEVGL